VKDCSYNEITDHFAKVHEVKVTKEDITRTLTEAGERARHLNGIYDYWALQGTKILEVDEIFQGQQNCYLGAACKGSRYLFLLEPLESREIESLERLLEPLVPFLDQLELVITDGLAAYKTVIPGIFDGVAHLFCQVHAYRVIIKEQESFNWAASRAKTKVTKLGKKLASARNTLYAKRRQLKRMSNKLDYLVQQRDAYYAARGIKKYSKRIEWTRKLLYFKTELNSARVRVRSRRKTLEKLEGRIFTLKRQLEGAVGYYKAKKQTSLQVGRLVKRFKDLLACPPERFKAERIRFTAVLQRSNYKIAPRILKFLKNNPHMFATKVPELARTCPAHLANTNTIEGIFGTLRPFLKKARHFHDTPATRALFAILRLRHNLTPPYTGPHNRHSPLERAGVHSRFENYLDALFPLPREDPSTREGSSREWQKKDLQPGLGIPPTNLLEVPAN
jgi:hypothetical protein